MVKLFSKNSNLCDHNSPTLQTDRQTTCDRNTALCTKVHRAVKTDWINTGHYKNLNTIGKQNYQEPGVEAELNFELFEFTIL